MIFSFIYSQEMFNTYETTVQQLRSEKYEIEKQKKQTEAQMQVHTYICLNLCMLHTYMSIN